ncbi:MAG: hypothetical protein ACI9YP_001556 [Colwellia sp.]|jgi:hypothetical protein
MSASTVTVVNILRKSVKSAAVLIELAARLANASSSLLFITAYPKPYMVINDRQLYRFC